MQESSIRLHPVTRAAIIAIGAIGAAAALRIAAVAALPIIASMILCLLFWPWRRWMCNRMPCWIAATICGLVMTLALGAIIGWGWYAADALTEEFQASRQKYVDQYEAARTWLTGIGVPEGSLPRVNGELAQEADANAFEFFGAETRREAISYVAGGLKTALGAFFALLLTIFLAVLVLYEGDRWRDWTRDKVSAPTFDKLEDLVQTWSGQTRWYLLGKTIGGLISGSATGLWLWAMGVPLPFVWGVLTFFMNYIPSIGALISGVPATILAVAYLGWGQGLIVGGGLVAIESLAGNFISPYFEGKMLRMSLWVILTSLVFWGWMWGVAGAVLAPILTAIIYVTVLKLRENDQGDAPANYPASNGSRRRSI